MIRIGHNDNYAKFFMLSHFALSFPDLSSPCWMRCLSLYFCSLDIKYQSTKCVMDNNHTDDYVLVLEDRTEVKNEAEVGKLSVVSDIDEKGKLKTAPAEEAQQSSFLKFSNKDGLLKNFMTNFLKQFKEPKRFGLYKVLAKNVEQGINNLK